MQAAPRDIQIIGNELALLWQDGREDYLPHALLRRESPSASNKGEVDVLGQQWGGEDGSRSFDGVTVTGWERVGNYALALHFSDGHRSGIFSWDYFRALADRQNDGSA